MKKINIIYALTLLFFLGSCEDAIEIDQPGRLPAEVAFESVSDLQGGLYGAYNQVDLNAEIYFTTVFTDEVAIGPENGGQGLSDYAFVLDPASAAPDAIWTRNYSIINSANRIIEAAAAITPEEGEQATYNNIMGQVYALRAFAHFQLQSYFTTDYTDDSALGVYAVDFVPTIDQNLPRNTNGEVFGLIEADLQQAESLLQTEASATFISQDFVTALRARMAAYRQDYTAAATYAQELLDKYDIADPDQYIAMFNDQDNTEIIFKLERTIGDSYDQQGDSGSPFGPGYVGVNWAFTGPGEGGGAYYVMSQALFNELNPADVRYTVNLHPDSDPDEWLYVDKYTGSESQPLMNDLKVFRSAEMLLILAEARVDQNDLEGAAELIKTLRDARFGEETLLPTYASQTEAFGAILDERRIEFAYEGHRYKDLKRLGERGNRTIQKAPEDCAFNGACSLDPASSHKFTFPLPLVELRANPGLREQQNPGY